MDRWTDGWMKRQASRQADRQTDSSSFKVCSKIISMAARFSCRDVTAEMVEVKKFSLCHPVQPT